MNKMNDHRDHRLGSEAPHSHLLQGLSILIFAIIWILDSFLLNFTTLLNNFIPLIARIIIFAIVLILAVLIMRLAEKILFKIPENRDELITEGIFGHVRHPLYFSVILIYLAFNFLSISLISFGVWVIIIFIYDRLATFEEKELERIYKEKYLEYKKIVSKWIPL